MELADPFQRYPVLPQCFSFERGNLYLAPAGLGFERGRRLAGGARLFTACDVLVRDGDRVRVTEASLAEVTAWAAEQGAPVAAHVAAVLEACAAPRPPFAGLTWDRPRVMGIINVTPDSFSDGGTHAEVAAAVAHGIAMLEAGADIIDVGGESTRPGAESVAPEVEAARVVPVVRALAERGALVSIDTRHAAVMALALEAGARILNDVTALSDPQALAVAAASEAAVVLMHMQGDPHTTQTAPNYRAAPLDVFDFLAERVAACVAMGIPPHRLCVDPGIGFGKTVAHNVQILGRLTLFQGLGCLVLLGASRKSFIARLSRDEAPGQRLGGSLSAVLAGVRQGVQIVRVHDVAETVQAIAVWRAIEPG
ncbi:MAG: dihydropteroate synthase [Alphaproteobacteria bacterium]|nr:dihydropteroate synthase [Alphaproteobacteria bacterium]